MKTKVLILVILFWSGILWNTQKEDDVVKVDGGIGLHISNELFESLKTDILVKGFEILMNLTIPDQNITSNVLGGLVKLNTLVQNITIVGVGCDVDNSTLRFSNTYPNILFQLIDFYLAVEFDYSLATTPGVYKDQGKASINVKPFKVNLGLQTNVTDEILSVDLNSFVYYFDDYSINFTGNGDISFVLVTLADTLKPIFQSDQSQTIQGLLQTLAIPQLNNLIAGLGTTFDIYNLTIDYAFMSQNYTAQDFGIVIKGEVRPQGGQPPPFVDDRKVPANYDPSGGFIQVFVSDYTIRSLLYSGYQSEIIKIKYDDNPLSEGKLTVGLMKYLIIDLTKKYKDSDIVYIEINTIDTPIPDFNIIDGETYVGLRLNLIIGVTPEGKDDVKIASMVAQVNLTLNFALENGNKLAPSISSFRLDLVGSVTNYDPDITVDTDDFNSTLGLIPGIARNFINYALDGFDIPIPPVPYVDLDLNQTFIYEKDGYLLLTTSPKINILTYRPLNRPPLFNPEKSYKNLLSTRESKVELIKRLVKISPMMGILEEAKRQKGMIKFNPEVFGTSFRRSKNNKEIVHDDFEESGKSYFEYIFS